MLCYQIDVSSAASGKHVAATKRRVRWRFGYANAKALDSGETGVGCRGTEHEITLVWSLTSGKRLVLMDQKEVHFSQGRRTEGKFATSWEMRNGQVMTIIAHAAPPLKQKAGFKQFDLQINGCSFHKLPHIYELGVTTLSNGSQDYSSGTRAGYSNYRVSGNKEMEWARTVHEQEKKYSMNNVEDSYYNNNTSDNRRNFAMNRDSPKRYQLGESQSSPTQSNLNSFHLVSDPILPSAGQNLVSDSTNAGKQDFLSAPVITHDEFQPAQFDPSQPPSYDAVWSSIMDAYDSAPEPAPAVTYSTTTSERQPIQDGDQETESKPNLSINAKLYYEPKEEKRNFFDGGITSPSGVNELSSAFNNLVNIDDLSSEAEAKSQKLTMMHDTKKSLRKSSNAIPPKAADWNLGPSPSLAQLKNLQTGPPSQKKEVMKASLTQAPPQTAGALVVYGDNQNMGYNNYGPPPLQYTSGFGVGATVVQDNSPHAQQQPYGVNNYNPYANQYSPQVHCSTY